MQPNFEHHPYTKPKRRFFARNNPRGFFLHPPKRGWLKTILLYGGIAMLAGVLVLVGMVGWFSRELPDPNKLLSRAIPLSTKIYDRSGTHILYEIHGDQQRTLVTLGEIPQTLKHATIVAEDRGFYSHQGFDVKGIIRAIAIDVLRGGKAQGGSTITQQFIKNSLLTSEKTFTRKLKELVLAYQLERNFSKDQILQLYLNEIPYGSTAYGVQAASRVYFDKDVKDLSLAESALLASLPKAPSLYSPWGNNRDRLIARQQKILDDMVSEGYIKKEEAESAKQYSLKFKEPGSAIIAPHFVMYVKELLSETYDEKTIEQGGLKVITSLDYDKQLAAEEELKRGAAKNIKAGASNAALVSINAKTGEVVAMVGSRDYFNDDIDGKVNVVLRQRQPGSSFKPIVYATAFKQGYTPRTMIYDVLTNFAVKGNDYIPKNYTGKEYGPVTMKQALAGSLNIAAVKTLYLAGVSNVIDFAKELGYTSLKDPNRYGLTLVLGGGEVSLLEHTGAFTAFAQDGYVVKPISILKVEDKQGRILEEFKNPERKKVFDAEIAQGINNILSDNNARAFVFGARNFLGVSGIPTAVKTGTTNDNRDAWTIGYTPSLVTGVWVGNNNNTPMGRGADGSQVAAPIWSAYMKRALKDTPAENFSPAVFKDTGKDILDGKMGKETKVKIDKITGKLATDSTPPELIEEKSFFDVHTILYYLDKNNPRGPQPSNPNSDPQFSIWENAVVAWAKKNNVGIEQPPSDIDDVHTAFNKPQLTILSPSSNETIAQTPFVVRVDTSAARGVFRVEFYIDETLIDAVDTAPFTLATPLAGFSNGFHWLVVKSYDDVGNVQTASIGININLAKQPPSLNWKFPTDNQKIAPANRAPLSLEIIPTDAYPLRDIRKLTVFATPVGQFAGQVILSVIRPESITTTPWPASLLPGKYTLSAEATDTNGTLIAQKRVRITVE